MKQSLLKFETDFSDISTDGLLKINSIIEKEFLKPFRKMGWRKGQYLATSPWKIMIPIQFEIEKRKKKK